MMKYSKIRVNGTRDAEDKAIPWTASTSERSKMHVGEIFNVGGSFLITKRGATFIQNTKYGCGVNIMPAEYVK